MKKSEDALASEDFFIYVRWKVSTIDIHMQFSFYYSNLIQKSFIIQFKIIQIKAVSYIFIGNCIL